MKKYFKPWVESLLTTIFITMLILTISIHDFGFTLGTFIFLTCWLSMLFGLWKVLCKYGKNFDFR